MITHQVFWGFFFTVLCPNAIPTLHPGQFFASTVTVRENYFFLLIFRPSFPAGKKLTMTIVCAFYFLSIERVALS